MVVGVVGVEQQNCSILRDQTDATEDINVASCTKIMALLSKLGMLFVQPAAKPACLQLAGC